jgi:hypothetical protein
MTTTHNARRRQHKHRTTSTHTRTVVSRSRTRQNRAVPADTVTRSPAPGAEIAVVAEPVVKVTKQIRTPDADDHLAAYFRQLAEHELLSPEDERELSQGIEDTEIMTWERVLSRPEIVNHILSLVEPNLEQPVKFPKLANILEQMAETKKARKEPKLVKKLVAIAKETAVQLRTLDLDRVHIDAVVRELYRAREAAMANEECWWDEAASKDAGVFLDSIRQAHRDAMSSCARTSGSWSRWHAATTVVACRSRT